MSYHLENSFVFLGGILSLGIFCVVTAIDPFDGNLPTFQCLKERPIKGCNETLLEAYKNTEASKSDVYMNEPDTAMYLYTRCNKDNPEFLHKCGGRLPENTVFRLLREVVIIIGGCSLAFCDSADFRELKDQLLVRANYNVIIIDWPWGNGADHYTTINNTKILGKQVAFLIDNIMEETGATGDNFHIIAHSTGAHAAGVAGRCVTRGKIRRISGLDPFGPGYIGASKDDILDKSDAKQVDVIHTSAARCIVSGGLGYNDPCGHADFYPNGGKVQPSCIPTILESYLKGDAVYATLSLVVPICFHLHSIQFFKTSINACHSQFIGVECSNYSGFKAGQCSSCGEDGSKCAVMGMDWEYYRQKEDNSSHSYYLTTDLQCPYCSNEGIDLQGFPKIPVKGCKRPRCFTPEKDT